MLQGDLSIDDLDLALLTLAIQLKRGEIIKHLITDCGARAHVDIEVNIMTASFFTKCSLSLTSSLAFYPEA